MKYFYSIFLVLAIISLLFSYTNLKTANKKIEEFRKVNESLFSESENYLNSLASIFPIKKDYKLTLFTGETIFLSEMNRPCLCFFFSSEDCMSCVEENIFSLFELAKNNKLKNILVVSTTEKSKYLQMIFDIQDASSIKYGNWSNETITYPSFYFMIFDNGDISNVYVPKKDEMEITLKYLNRACKVLSLNNFN